MGLHKRLSRQCRGFVKSAVFCEDRGPGGLAARFVAKYCRKCPRFAAAFRRFPARRSVLTFRLPIPKEVLRNRQPARRRHLPDRSTAAWLKSESLVSWFRNSHHRYRESVVRISDHNDTRIVNLLVSRSNPKFAPERAAKYGELRIRDTRGYSQLSAPPF
jgi:hypothetical protein